jgi:hypothetical protein
MQKHDPMEFVIRLDNEKAWALARLLAHVDYSLCKSFALTDREACMMSFAVNEIRILLGQFGFLPMD